MRSGTARLSHGPASMPRHHASASARVCGSIVGSVIESFTAGGKVWSPPDGRKAAVVVERCETARTDGAQVMKLGVVFGYWGASPRPGVIELARDAERLGYDSVWVAESWGNDAFTFGAWVAAHTETIKI